MIAANRALRLYPIRHVLQSPVESSPAPDIDPDRCPLIRVQIEPTPQNRLRAASHVMIDKAATLPVDKLGPSFGTVDDATMVTLNRALALFLGLAS